MCSSFHLQWYALNMIHDDPCHSFGRTYRVWLYVYVYVCVYRRKQEEASLLSAKSKREEEDAEEDRLEVLSII